MARKGDNIRKRKDGRWEARYITSYDINGKAIYKSIYSTKYLDIKKEKIKRENQLNTEKQIDNSTSITVEQATAQFLSKIKPKVKESTYARYNFICEKHIIPYFKQQKISKLTNETLEKFIIDKQTIGSLKGGYLSPKTVNDILCVLIQILKKHICFNIDLEKPENQQKEIITLLENEYNKFKDYISITIDNKKLGIMIAMLTGIRLGELCALKWGDIDLENRIITVNKTLQRIKDTDKTATKKTKIIISSPKSHTSNRMLPIPFILANKLKEFKSNANNYILTNTTGFIEPRTYQRHFKKYLKECGIKDNHFHVLRHTFATKAVTNGIDIKTLSMLLGHTDVSFTMKRYVHPDIEHKKLQIEKIAVGF